MMKPTTGDWQGACEDGLRFFGEMSASVSHDIRNKLAVINEKAGLLNDLAHAMQSGRGVDPNRLEVQASKITDQVKQANQIVRALNRLAHSVDRTRASIEAGETVRLAAELNRRKASMANIGIETIDPAEPVSVVTSPFLLERLVSHCIDLAFAHIGEDRTLQIAVGPSNDGASIRFQGLVGIGPNSVDLGDDQPGRRFMLEQLGGRLSADGDGSAITLVIKNLEVTNSGGQS